MKTTLLTAIALMTAAAATPVHARRGGGAEQPARPETISCGLTFDGRTLVGTSSAPVVNAQALLRGEAQGVSYVFSVRGKTAIARMTIAESGQVLTAQGAIEMLRRGGEAQVQQIVDTPRPVTVDKRRGEDDANDGQEEREAGLQLSVALTSRPQQPVVALKCESVNQPAEGVTP